MLVLALASGWVAHGLLSVDTHGARIERFTLHSKLLHRSLQETLVAPPRGGDGRPLLVFLHGRGADGQNSNLSDELFAGLAKLGRDAPDIVFANGGVASYFHDRASGRWGSYVVDEVIPAAIRRLHADPRRVAIGGVSMGGFGALDIARVHPGRFCAVGGHSAALWESGGETPAGAFDDTEDFARHDVLGAARAHPDLFAATPVWLDVGTEDPFRAADTALASTLRGGGAHLTFHVWPGAHRGSYWRSHMATYLRFYARALARCDRPSGP